MNEQLMELAYQAIDKAASGKCSLKFSQERRRFFYKRARTLFFETAPDDATIGDAWYAFDRVANSVSPTHPPTDTKRKWPGWCRGNFVKICDRCGMVARSVRKRRGWNQYLCPACLKAMTPEEWEAVVNETEAALLIQCGGCGGHYKAEDVSWDHSSRLDLCWNCILMGRASPNWLESHKRMYLKLCERYPMEKALLKEYFDVERKAAAASTHDEEQALCERLDGISVKIEGMRRLVWDGSVFVNREEFEAYCTERKAR